MRTFSEIVLSLAAVFLCLWITGHTSTALGLILSNFCMTLGLHTLIAAIGAVRSARLRDGELHLDVSIDDGASPSARRQLTALIACGSALVIFQLHGTAFEGMWLATINTLWLIGSRLALPALFPEEDGDAA